MKISDFNFGEYDARREFLRAEEYFLSTFISPTSFPLHTLSNKRNFIIVGQKGAGKTASQLFLEYQKAREQKYSSALLSFHDDLSPEEYKTFSQTQKINLLDLDLKNLELQYDFREVWKRILLMKLAKTISKPGTENAFIQFCEASTRDANSILDGIKKSLKIELKIPLGVFSTKLSFDPSKLEVNNEVSISDFNKIALELLSSECKASKVFFFVDELVISTMNTKSDEYKIRTCLIRDLVKTCSWLNDFFVKNNLDFHIICSLRPEIRDRLNDSDPEISKLMDGSDVPLLWEENSLSSILREKISNGRPNKNSNENFDVEKFLPEAINFGGQTTDLPPLKWSSLKYDFRTEDKIDGKEEAYG